MTPRPIQILLNLPAEKLPAEASRLWGNAALPADMPFPTYIDDEGDDFPYVFVGQINLADIAPLDPDSLLPHSGLLSFFAKIDGYLGDMPTEGEVSGYISEPDAVRVCYIPAISDDLSEVVLIDDDDVPFAPREMAATFVEAQSKEAVMTPEGLVWPDAASLDDTMLFALPTHREWQTWDPPFESWQILLQVDSSDTPYVNFMDCGVLCFLIAPDDLRDRRFDRVRAIVLST